jgi:hypothetical protein
MTHKGRFLLGNCEFLIFKNCSFQFAELARLRIRVILGDYNVRNSLDGREKSFCDNYSSEVESQNKCKIIFIQPFVFFLVLCFSRYDGILICCLWFFMTFQENDIAILKLRNPVTFTNYIQPICISESVLSDNIPDNFNSTSPYYSEIKYATIVGWRRTRPNLTQKSPTPVKASIPIRNHEQCRKSYEPYLVSKSMLCAGGNGTAACLVRSICIKHDCVLINHNKDRDQYRLVISISYRVIQGGLL